MSEPTLAKIHALFLKHFELKDTKRVDAALAVALLTKKRGVPVWLFFVGASSDLKTETLRMLQNWSYTELIQILTRNTFMSGNPVAQDYAVTLDGKLGVISDMSDLLSKDSKEKSEIFAQMRALYDGYAIKRSGSGKATKHTGICFNLLAASTDAFDSQIVINQQLGSRELVFRIEADAIDHDKKMDQALVNESELDFIRKEIGDATLAFLDAREYKDAPLDPLTKDEIKKMAKRLAILRAPAQFDSNSGELRSRVTPEVPTRIVLQFQRLYKALMSLEDGYTQERALEVIKCIADSSADPLRGKVLDFLKGSPDEYYSLSRVAKECTMGKKPTREKLEALWGCGLVEKDVTECKSANGYEFDTIKWRYKHGQQKLV